MRIIKVMGNEPVNATIGGKYCHFRSQLEYKWAKYLQFLKNSGEIKDWFYESLEYRFEGEKIAPYVYRPDFEIHNNDGSWYMQECKGWHDGTTNSKFCRMAKHYPDVVMELVLMRIPKNSKGKSKTAHRRAVASKYCRRIIDASEIFKQIKGLVNLEIIVE